MPLVKPTLTNGKSHPECSVIVPMLYQKDGNIDGIETLLKDESRTAFELIIVVPKISPAERAAEFKALLESKSDKYKLIQLEDRFTYARAINVAAKVANGKFLMLLQDKLLPLPGWLDRLVAAIKTENGIGVVGAKLINPLHRLVYHAGIIFNKRGEPIYIYQGFPDDHPAVNKRRVYPAVSGASMLVSRAIFEALGGMDERYADELADIDFCLRSGELGRKVVYEPSAAIFYQGDQKPMVFKSDSPRHNLFKEKWDHVKRVNFRPIFHQDGYEAHPIGDGFALKPMGINLKAEMDAAREDLKNGRLQDAVERYQKIYMLVPHALIVIKYLARIYEMRGDYEMAMTMLLRLASLQPDSEPLVKLADLTLKMKNFALSRRFAYGVLEAVPDGGSKIADARAILGDAWFKSEKLDLAEIEYKKAIEYSPSHARALTGLGTIALTNKDYSRALTIFERALTERPHHGRAILGKGLAYLGLGRLEVATECISDGVRIEPDNSWALTTLLPLLSTLGKLDIADNLLANYLELYPDDAPVILARAGVAFGQKDHNKCRHFLDQVFEIDPSNTGALELDIELAKESSSRRSIFSEVLA